MSVEDGRAQSLDASLGQVRSWLGQVATTLRPIVVHPMTERIIMLLIIVNALTMGLETSGSFMAEHGSTIHFLDHLILAVFVVEIASRIIVHGRNFWKDPWSIFDFTVIAVTFMPGANNVSVLRALRTIRALRLISIVPSMRRVVNSLVIAIPGMTSIVILLLLIFYVFAVMATKMFGAAFPELFGSIGSSAYSLFQVMTLEGWSQEIVRPIMVQFPWAWAFFIPFILITTFTVLNLFIGIIVDAMQQQHAEMRAESQQKLASKVVKLDEAIATGTEIQRTTDAVQDKRMDALFNELKFLRGEMVALRSDGAAMRKTT